MRFDDDTDEVDEFVVKLLTLVRIVYHYDTNGDIPAAIFNHHMKKCLANFHYLRRFYTEILQYTVIDDAGNINFQEIAERLNRHLDDRPKHNKKVNTFSTNRKQRRKQNHER